MTKPAAQKHKRPTANASAHKTLLSKHGRLVHHRHTGRHVPLRYTSYAILYFLLALTGALLLFAGQSVRADQQQGSITLGGVVQAPPPGHAPLVVQPLNNAHFNTAIIEVKGLCQDGLVVETYRNDTFSGAVFCNVDGNFQITITLVPGPNRLYTKQADSAGQYSPNSAVITVFYDVPQTAPAPPTTGAANPSGNKNSSSSSTFPSQQPLLIHVAPVQWGVSPGSTFILNYEINGGTPAYAVTIDWQDKSRDSLYSYDKAGSFSATHRYIQAGPYAVTISASDKLGNQTLIQTVIIVNGKAVGAVAAADPCVLPAAANTLECNLPNRIAAFLDKVWPALIVATLMATSFWGGERMVLSHPPRRLRPVR
jgi:hypothetical protein